MGRVRLALACAVAGALIASCTNTQGSSGATKQRLSIATGGTGGVFYPYGGGIAKIISDNLPGVDATVEVTAASIDNLKFLKQGTSDIAFTMADIAQDALTSRDAFTTFGAVPLRTLAVLYSSYTHLVASEESGIRNVAQLKGHVVSVGAAGSGTTTLALRILEAAGLDSKRDLRRQNLGVAQSVDAMKDGKIDAFFWNGGLPTASVLDLVNTPGMKVRFISTDTLLPRLEQMFGPALYYRERIPKTTYKMDADASVIAVANLLVVSDTMAEPLAYDITRLLFDKQRELAAIHPQARTLNLKAAATGSPIPFHPGAIRLYRERHAWTD
jgi:TRAP transporter TAXI family solute receptor